MRRPWQYTLLGAAVAFFVLYGIELASDGMEDVYGPMEPRAERRASSAGGYSQEGDPYPSGARGVQTDRYDARPDGANGVSSGTGAAQGRGDEMRNGIGGLDVYDRYDSNDEYQGYDGYGSYDGYGYPYDGRESGGTAGRLADGTAGLLQSAAKGGIRFIVSLFESVAK